MKYLNGETALRSSEGMMRASNEQIGAWFLLWSYCHEQMNGGIITACQEWPDSIWQRVANTTGASMAQDSSLWHWVGTGLVIHNYNADAEKAYRTKQKQGRLYAERRWSAQKAKKIIQLESSISGKPQKDNAS